MKLWLLRHAAVALPPGICYGATDVAADELATRAAAKSAAALLPMALPVRVSALRRARALAAQLEIVRPDLGPAAVDARLNEMNFGCWELQRWEDISRESIDAWAADFDAHRFGGVESTRCVISRVAAALDEFRATAGSGAEVLWITHAGVIGAVQHIARHGRRDVGSASQWPRSVTPCAGVLQLDIE